MPDTTLHPAGQRRADAVVAQPVLTPYQALRQLGWIHGIDFVFMFLLTAVLVTVVFWHIFAAPTGQQLALCALCFLLLFQVWQVLLILRCARFVLDLAGHVHTLPDAAARIVMAAYSGRSLPKT